MSPKSKNLEVGTIGEDIACRFLKGRGFKIIERNYWKKWGEIDIVAKKGNITHFVEVKSVSREIIGTNVSRETFKGGYQPEDMVHPWKIKRMQRVIQSYILEKKFSEHTRWQFDILAVFIDLDKKKSIVRFTENMMI